MKPFDPTKPCRTRNGKSARIICTDAKGSKPIIALISDCTGVEIMSRYCSDGLRLTTGEKCMGDLINIPEKHEMWVNVYGKIINSYNIGDGYVSKEQADKAASLIRIACIKVPFEEGEGL